MDSSLLQSLLVEGRPLLADGATGTNLFAAGLTSGDSPELWNATHPERIQALHQAFVEAGSDIILTNSFGGNRRRLALHGSQARARELNRLAAENARAVADKAGYPVVVAGSVGPTGDIFAPLGPLTEDEAVDVFAEQIDGLREGGADVVWIETMSAAEEISAAALAAARVGAPFTVTASFDTAGRTMMGVAPANAGVPHWHGAEIHYSGTPELMERYAALAVDCGARIVGGCCGHTPAHVAAIRRGLDTWRPGPRPDVERIVAALGPLAAPPAAEGGGRRRRERT